MDPKRQIHKYPARQEDTRKTARYRLRKINYLQVERLSLLQAHKKTYIQKYKPEDSQTIRLSVS